MSGFDEQDFFGEGPSSRPLRFSSIHDLPTTAGVNAEPNVLPLEGFRFFDSSPTQAETAIGMSWDNPFDNSDGVAKVYRLIEPLLAPVLLQSGSRAILLPDDDSLSPYTWHLIATLDAGFSTGHYLDKDIPPVNVSLPRDTRRRLPEAYSYMVEIRAGDRIARSPSIRKRLRGINEPTIESAVGISDTEVRVRWRDNSLLASGFNVRSRLYDDSDQSRVVIVNGTTNRDLVVYGLTPDTEYFIDVRAWDFYGASWWDSERASTLPTPDVEPQDKTFDVSLTRQQIFEGFIPYLGRFPTWGDLPSGTLRTVSLHEGWPTLLFVKPGHSTDECDDPDAVVVLEPGTSLTADEMAEAFGDGTPNLPIVFVACASWTPQLFNYIPIRITYRPD